MATITTTQLLPQPRPTAASIPHGQTEVIQPGSPLGYAIFLVLNFILFVRPSEFVPGLKGLEIYQLLIVLCLAFSMPDVLRWFDARRLGSSPTLVCVMGLLIAMILSHLVRLAVGEAVRWGVEFLKILVYFVLFVSLVNTPQRLKQFLWYLTICCFIIATLNVLQYNGVIQVTDLKSTKEEGWDPELGVKVAILRLQSTGTFADPNEMCVLLVVAIVLSLYWVTDHRSGAFALVWLVPLAVFFYALVLTQSRGGFLALVAALAVFFRARFGWGMTLLLGSLALPALLVLVGGRQASLSTATGTAQDRIQMWSDSLMEMRTSPLFGIGYDQLAANGGLVAHNSFIQAFAELGLLGGILFFGAFYLGARGMVQLTLDRRTVLDPELRRMLPYVTAVLVGYLVGMMSLTLNDRVPTFTVLAMVTVYLAMVRTDPPLPQTRFDLRLFGRLTVASLIFLAFMYLFIRILMQRG
jgi:O-antigen ligase